MAIVEAADGFDDRLHFVFAEAGVHGQREDLGGGAFGVGEVAGFVAERGQGFCRCSGCG